ncbi:hypothetical protein XA68_10774 [Ophiocordyceps unilateralis]|uniref:NAD(P)-binding protein n=1 Tax=Ophiocordyceps unilateralis TaxID=268505 RepID=A0A2A9NYX2_OPHUN|nr:hypothetical protein XA68_10774 [Ophiocordyceps unilateralis]
MSSRIKTILIIGATSGIGEAFARRFHGLGKKVIATGRNQEKLKGLAQELPGLEARQLFIDDIGALAHHVAAILSEFPTLDTVIITAGIQHCFSLLDASTTKAEEMASEITTNLTAPTVLVHHLAPHLMKLAESGTKTTLFLTSSTLAYIPLSFYPSYCASKAGVAALTKVLRQQLGFASDMAKRNMAVVEIVPPYTDTTLDKAHREATISMQGGVEKAFLPMPLHQYVDGFFAEWEQAVLPDGSVKQEIGLGMGQLAVDTWRESFGRLYEPMGIST